MIAHAQLLVALVAGALAGLVFLLVGGWLMGRERGRQIEAEQAEAPALQPRKPVTQDNLSPEALAFIKALQSHKEPPAKAKVESSWAVDIWDTRQSPGGAQGLRH